MPQPISGNATIDTPGDGRERYGISDLSREFDVTPRALRFYEDQGLIAPERSGLSRIYSKRDRARLAWILRAKRVGFSLSEIREMIDLYDVDDGRNKQRRVTIEKCRERIDSLTRQKADIESAIDELIDFVAQVEEVEREEMRETRTARRA
ncbi:MULTISPECIES: MerR family transcriptional regulator [Novosphingopyxis]|uniref:MerR family transcriptional regulator n=1 Tax=Novosphingopyxis TaxID=2709686 RepID=UPI000C63A2FF|nr:MULTISPECIES: MerR family DNA-binding transcriptional regulator [Novosphingopyxis]MAC12501.1 transcriptional regulator [Sphingorhabdus sp.]MBH9538260.1 MerR family DNA-binding transcriptional regulator [Novosphingopyxis sp. YJ-S2-01]|tara:strand:+ start:1022 stop:1474 length:453 start_codon:yes stop_codon:yes gene_type:complete